jgi:1,2-phenylacetyl-CoA epoxidase PaaB subunit
MTTRNPITGDPIQTKPATDNYRENFDRVFRKACPRCGKVNAADIHTCTPPEVMQAQQQLTDLAQGEGYGLCDKCDPDTCCRL